MNHTIGVICQFGTAHSPDQCSCGTEHGYMQVSCPTPGDCQQFSVQCPTCNPDASPVPTVRLTVEPPAPLPPGAHAHPAQTPEDPVVPEEPQTDPVVPNGYENASEEDLPDTGPGQ